MKSVSLICIALFLLLLTAAPLLGDEWRWEEDLSFLNPNLAPEMVRIGGYIAAGGFYDLSGDGKPEYVIALSNRGVYSLELAASEGDFPAIRWSLRSDFFPALEFDRNFLIESVSFHDLDADGAVEIIFNSSVILKNRGDFDQPDWVRADDLFPNVQHEDGTPHFCDWDGDGMEDLIFTYDNGYFRYERDREGRWESLGFTECVDVGWGISTHLADLDGDGEPELILNSLVSANQWAPAVYRKTGGQHGQVAWERVDAALADGGPSGSGDGALADVDNDGKLDLISGSTVWLNRYSLAVDDEPPLPIAAALTVSPNPTNGTATLRYSLPQAGKVVVALYDVSGRELWSRNLGIRSAGNWVERIALDGVPGGSYLVEVSSGSYVRKNNLTLIR